MHLKIRTKDMTRDVGIEMVKKYDSVVSSDLYHWLDYVDMSEDEFWNIADTLEIQEYGGFKTINGIRITFGIHFMRHKLRLCSN